MASMSSPISLTGSLSETWVESFLCSVVGVMFGSLLTSPRNYHGTVMNIGDIKRKCFYVIYCNISMNELQ